jgi:hypothetical protein
MLVRGIVALAIDIGFLILAVYFAFVERGTFGGWCWAIAAVAWIALIINAIIFASKSS